MGLRGEHCGRISRLAIGVFTKQNVKARPGTTYKHAQHWFILWPKYFTVG